MRLIRDYHNVPQAAKGAVIALGNIDGCHLGHRELLKEASYIARERNVPLAVMTFEPHPREFFNPDASPIRLSPLHIKAQLLKECGVGVLFALRFNQAFSKLSAQDFIKQVLHEGCAASHIITGEDFMFGHRRSGSVADIVAYGRQAGAFTTSQIVPIGDQQQIYSSTQIRHFLQSGDIEHANAMLGRPYEIVGRVIHGDRRGRAIGFPTANIRTGPMCLPKRGVYAVKAVLWDNNPDLLSEPNMWDGVANLGYRPTFGGSYVSLEVHLKDIDENLYGKRLRVAFKHFIRPEETFAGVEALKNQITKDCETAWEILSP